MREVDDGEVPELALLRCFVLLHRERHLSRAAARAGSSQPAMSRALGRLRAWAGDPLFVRTPRGMVPTARADELAPEIEALIAAARALGRPPAFDPARLVRTFTLATAGFFDGALIPRLVGALLRDAPGVSIATRSAGDGVGEVLASGRVDLMIGIARSLPADARRAKLYADRWVCAVRRDHPRVGRRLTLARFVELPHLLVAPGGYPGSVVDSALAARQRVRRVAVRLHQFAAAPAILAASDLIATVPARAIDAAARAFGLRLLAPPIALEPVPVFVAWHPRVQADPAHAWFRQQVHQAAQPEPEPEPEPRPKAGARS